MKRLTDIGNGGSRSKSLLERKRIEKLHQNLQRIINNFADRIARLTKASRSDTDSMKTTVGDEE